MLGEVFRIRDRLYLWNVPRFLSTISSKNMLGIFLFEI